jgi:hypothetical protein
MNEAEGSPKRQKRATQINGKFNADEKRSQNAAVQPSYKSHEKRARLLTDRRLRSGPRLRNVTMQV